MTLRDMAVVLLFALGALALAALLLTPAQQGAGAVTGGPQRLEILEVGRAGDYGYAVVDYEGSPNVTLLAYHSPPLRKVTILNEPGAIAGGSLARFISDLSPLQAYGFTVDVSANKALGHGIFVVPTGALPSYVLDDLRYNATDATVIYIGRTDLVLSSSGVTQEDWYSALDQRQLSRLIIHNTTPDQFIEGNASLSDEVLENGWAVRSRLDSALSGEGRHTLIVPMNGSEYVRLIASLGGKVAMVDSARMRQRGIPITPSPPSIFPWEKTAIEFSLNKTNGTAMLSISLDGKEVYSKPLSRVREENYFVERPQLNGSGNHVIRVTDNSGIIGGGILHVKDLRVDYLGSSGFSYNFNVTVDGTPVDSGEAAVHLDNSTLSKKFYISGGLLTVPAQLQQGVNVFDISFLGTERHVEVAYSREGLADVYLKYGIPGLLLVVIIYFGARMTRKPVYVIRVGEAAGEIRKEVKMPPQKALSVFRSIRKELGIGKNPITAHEFSLAIKRHVTEGADVTEGNVEELLQRMVKLGLLESHKQYYQLKGEGDVKRNAMMRRIRDKLIESGIAFRMRGGCFVTSQVEIGLFGERFSRNAVVVIEDQHELDSIHAGLTQKQLAALQVKLANGVLRLVPLDRLADVL